MHIPVDTFREQKKEPCIYPYIQAKNLPVHTGIIYLYMPVYTRIYNNLRVYTAWRGLSVVGLLDEPGCSDTGSTMHLEGICSWGLR